MKGIKYAATVLFVLLLVCVCSLPVFAEAETPRLPEEEWGRLGTSVPDEVKDRLPEGTFDNESGFSQGVESASAGEYIAEVILDIVGIELGSSLKLLFVLCALIILAAVFSAFGEGLENSALSSAVRFCSAAALIGAVIYTQYSHFELLEELFSKLNSMMAAMIPVTASIWAMGGNVGTASVGSASFGVIVSVSEAICANTVLPFCCVMTVFGFCDALGEEIKTARIMNAVKKVYVFALGLIMTVLLSALGAQTTLASSADSTAARTARLVSGTVIPIVGGSVGETFRTVAAGVGYLKNVFGIGGIIMIALLVLPTFISILLTRFTLMLCGGLADMLGCSSEARMLDNLSEVYGFMLGTLSCVAVTFMLALYIFMQTVVAVA